MLYSVGFIFDIFLLRIGHREAEKSVFFSFIALVFALDDLSILVVHKLFFPALTTLHLWKKGIGGSLSVFYATSGATTDDQRSCSDAREKAVTEAHQEII